MQNEKKNNGAKPTTLSGKSVHAVIQGIARLVEGQRRFADELGLPYSRLFQDGFEAFKDRPVEDVLLCWLTENGSASSCLETLFTDLLEHQLALVQALAELEPDSAAESGWVSRLSRLVGNSGPAQGQGTHRSYMEVTAPAYVAAYARAREQYQVP